MKSKIRGIIIDLGILMFLAFIIMLGIYILYEVFLKLLCLVTILIIFINISMFWGTIICYIKGEPTIGNRLVKKKGDD